MIYRIAFPPSDVPAAELPDVEPTPADLLAIESWPEDRVAARVEEAVVLAAYEARRRELQQLRRQLTKGQTVMPEAA